MIHHYALIAEFEYDDENGEYPPPSFREVSRDFDNAMFHSIKRLDLKETHFEVAYGTLHETFGVPEVK